MKTSKIKIVKTKITKILKARKTTNITTRIITNLITKTTINTTIKMNIKFISNIQKEPLKSGSLFYINFFKYILLLLLTFRKKQVYCKVVLRL